MILIFWQTVPTNPNGFTQILVAIIAGAAVVTAALVARMARRRSRPENESIIVSTSQLLVGLSREEIERLDKEKDRLENLIHEIQHDLEKQIAALRAERDQLREELSTAHREKDELEERVRLVEEENTRLRQELEQLKGKEPV